MPIDVTASDSPITVSASGTKIDATVSGGQGPAGSAGAAATIAVGTVTTGSPGSSAAVVNAGTSSAAVFNFTIPAGATGATGATGPAGTTTWAGITDKPSTFTPSSHTHAISDVTDLATTLSGIDSALDGKAAASHAHGSITSDGKIGTTDGLIVRTTAGGTVGLASSADDSGTLSLWGPGTYSHVYVGGTPPTGRSGSGIHCTSSATTEISSYTAAGIWFGSGGAIHWSDGTTQTTAWTGKIGTTAGLVLKTGTAGAVEALAMGTAGQVLKVNSGATGVEWGAAAADVSIDTTAADILSASSGSITADDPGADRIVFWDDSAGKLTHLTVGTGLSISDTTLTASVSASDISQGTLAYARMADPTVTSPSQITANQNDYASFARGINRFTTNAARDITGMVAGSDGEIRVLCNVGTTAANTLTIKDESSSSTAANRFSVPWGSDCVIQVEGSVVVFYDGTSSRWRVL